MRHGLAIRGSVHPVYRAWCRIIRVCTNPRDAKWGYYGGRGIRVCQRWQDASAFISDMLPSWRRGLSLHRKNNDGHYSPRNCVWANRIEQGNCKRNNLIVTVLGTQRTLGEWSRLTGVSWGTLFNRIYVMRWDPQRAVFTPTRPHKPYSRMAR